MADETRNLAARGLSWLFRRPAHMLLTVDDERLAAEAPERFARAWIGLMLAGLLWGTVLANLWGIAWKVFRDDQPLITPAMAACAVFCLWPFRRGLGALASILGGRDAAARAVAAAAVVLIVGLCLLALKPDWHRFEAARLPAWVAWLRPDAKLYRVLLLMPPWGAWAMLITVKFCRSTERTEPQVAAFAAGCGAVPAVACMAGLLLASIAYFHHLGPGSQVGIPVATGLAAIGAGVGFCRLAGGVCRRCLLAANVTTQIAFLLAYLAGR